MIGADSNRKGHRSGCDRLYRIWKAMRCRCNNPNFKEYYRYGGRGIKVCKEWGNYNLFRNWATEHGYEDSLTIDRINNNGDYSPDNCRWITISEQQQTRSNCRMLYYQGRVQNMSQWAKEYGLKKHTLKARLNRGWTIERALTEAVA